MRNGIGPYTHDRSFHVPSRESKQVRAGQYWPGKDCEGLLNTDVLQYITDSVLPDGRPISLARPPSSSCLQDDEADSDEGEVGGCECEVGEARMSTCTRADGASCECVGDFGKWTLP
jgi:hypothetical protein